MSEVNFERLIRLTNIEVDKDILDKLSDSVENIVTWCEELQEVDTTNVDPMFSVFDIFNKGLAKLREDEVTDGNVRDKILKNCSDKNDMFVCVPKVIDQE